MVPTLPSRVVDRSVEPTGNNATSGVSTRSGSMTGNPSSVKLQRVSASETSIRAGDIEGRGGDAGGSERERARTGRDWTVM